MNADPLETRQELIHEQTISYLTIQTAILVVIVIAFVSYTLLLTGKNRLYGAIEMKCEVVNVSSARI